MLTYMIPTSTNQYVDTTILLVALLCMLRYYIHRRWQYLERLGIPHDPPTIFSYGNMTELFGQDAYYERFSRAKKKHGPVYGSYMGLEPVIIIHDTEMMRQIYIKEFQHFPDRQKIFTRLNGKDINEGLLSSSGNQWKRTRSALSPAFSVSKVKLMRAIVDGCVEQTLLVLDDICRENRQFSAKKLYSNLALDVIVSTALGTKVNMQTSCRENTRLTKEIRNAFAKGFSSPVAVICMFIPSSEWVFEKLGCTLFPARSLQYIRDFTDAVIEDRAHGKGERCSDLLQLMFDAEVPENATAEEFKKGISRKELIGNAMLMLGAGSENVSIAMTTMSHCLAFHPVIQEKLQHEIDTMFRDKGYFDYDVVKQLKYLDMCVNETMRLYPVVIVNSRVCRSDTVVNGLRIPKGTLVEFPVNYMAHDPDYWEDPWEYIPERMRDMSEIDPMMFQPFGAGPRNCIGMKFAEMEIKMTMCRILHKYSFEPCKDTPKPPLEMTLKLALTPKEDFMLRLVKR